MLHIGYHIDADWITAEVSRHGKGCEMELNRTWVYFIVLHYEHKLACYYTLDKPRLHHTDQRTTARSFRETAKKSWILENWLLLQVPQFLCAQHKARKEIWQSNNKCATRKCWTCLLVGIKHQDRHLNLRIQDKGTIPTTKQFTSVPHFPSRWMSMVDILFEYSWHFRNKNLNTQNNFTKRTWFSSRQKTIRRI